MKMILKATIAAAILLGSAAPAAAQSACQYIVFGATLTAAQWNSCFQSKADLSTVQALSPGGLNGSVQFNNNNSLGGTGGVASDGTALIFQPNDLKLLGGSSGSSFLNAPATGGGTATLFPGTDTVVGAAATQTLTNKSMSGLTNTFTDLPASSLPTGKSVVISNSVLESTLPVQTSAGASKIFATADIQYETRRSNSGSAMADTFPASGAAGMVNGARITVNNVDASANDTITAGAGTTVAGTGVVEFGRSVTYVYDLANTTWRPTFDTGTLANFASVGSLTPGDVVSIASAYGKVHDAGTMLGNVGNIGPSGLFTGAISSAPASTCNTGSISTAFSCDLTKNDYAIGHVISGAATLGQPTSGYVYTPNAYNFYTYTANSSGWNNSTSGNVGRTMATDHYSKIDNTGQGDATNFAGICFVNSARAGATDFLANPECGIVSGQADAGQSGVYEDLDEMQASDEGLYDIAAIGLVRNFNRTVTTGALNAWWGGVRIQSQGSGEINNAFSAVGPMAVAFDLTGQTLDGTTKAGMVTPSGWRWYGNGTHGTYIQNGLGTDWVVDNTGLSGWQFVQGNTSALLAGGALSYFWSPLEIGVGAGSGGSKNNYVHIQGAANGSDPVLEVLGVSDANVSLDVIAKGTGSVNFIDGSNALLGQFTSGSLNLGSGIGFNMNSTTVIDSSRNGTFATVTVPTVEAVGANGNLTVEANGTGALTLGQSTNHGTILTTAPIAEGTQPTLTGTCTTSTQVGGTAAGSFEATCTAQTVILTFPFSAPNGWVVTAQDMTTPADTMKQTANSANSATLTGTTVANDVVVFQATAY